MQVHYLRSSPLLAAFALLMMTVFAGCDDSQGPGRLRAYWHLGSQTCEDSGIAHIRVHVVTDGDDVVNPVLSTCDQGSTGLAIGDVPTGVRQVLVDGLDELGVIRYEGQSGDVTIHQDQETVIPSVALGLRRASARVRWGFSNQYVCGANGVATIRLTAFDAPGNLVGGPDVHPCDVPLTADDPDGGVILSGLPANTDLTLIVLGLNVVDQPTFGVAKAVRAGPGDTVEVPVLLDKCDAGAPCP